MNPSPQPESPEPLKVVEPFGYVLHWPKIGGGVALLFDKSRAAGDAIGCKVTPLYEEAAIQAARNEADAKPIGNPDWLRCETRRPWVANSLRESAKKMRASEKRARNAFQKDFMGVPCQYIADVYAEAAAVFEARLNAINAAMKGDAHA